MSKTIWQNVVTATLVACALVMTGVTVRREFFPQDGTRSTGHVDDWKSLTAGRIPDMGKTDAGVEVIVFSDYQCPFCKDLDEKLARLHKDAGLDFSVWRYESPLTAIHPYAFKAAVAAKRAALQGIRIDFQEELFVHAENLGVADLLEAADKSDVKSGLSFANCLNDPSPANLVRKDMETAKKLGVTGTPVFIVNGDAYSGTQQLDHLRDIISGAM